MVKAAQNPLHRFRSNEWDVDGVGVAGGVWSSSTQWCFSPLSVVCWKWRAIVSSVPSK
jgi:hypothetical protein